MKPNMLVPFDFSAGSIAEHILRHADWPVATVHARADKEVTP